MKITDEAVEAALEVLFDHGHNGIKCYDPRPGLDATVREALEAALPHLTDDGAAAPPADPNGTPAPTGADQAAESATTTAAPSSPHLREALGALAADWRSLPRDPDSVATTVLRHCGAQLVSVLASYPVAGATPAIDREALAAAAHKHFCVMPGEPTHEPDEIDYDKADEILEILALIEGAQ